MTLSRSLMTRDLRSRLIDATAGMVIGMAITALAIGTEPDHTDDTLLPSVTNNTPTPNFDKALKEHKAVIGCMDGIFVIGGITFWGMSEVITRQRPYAIIADDLRHDDPAFVYTWRCNAYNRFTQD